mgnify:CR=1 FL=1
MKHYKTLALSTVAVLGLSISTAHADGANFTSHHLVPEKDYSNYAESLPAEDKLELREYLNYEEREPCQGYQNPPHAFVEDRCDLDKKHAKKERKFAAKKVETRTAGLRPVISDYTIYFDFDKSNVRASERSTLETVVREIKRYDPYEVTIEGHTDRSGPADYNAVLSQKRAQAVSNALTDMGITNRVLDKEAKGESDPAVPTKDGVKLQENRRVEIQFRK